MPDTVRYDLAGGVATLTLNRPESLNSLSLDMKVQLLQALRAARDDANVRALVLTGAGRAFCVGQDLVEHAQTLAEGHGIGTTVREHYLPITQEIASMPKPVVAAVNGMAAGAGAAFAFAADFRLAADGAAFLMAFARVGLAADSGASWTLQRLVGFGRATALLMLAEPIAAPAALEMGLVNAVVPAEDLLATTAELAAKLAAGPTAAYAGIKRQLAYAAAADLPESLVYEAMEQERAGLTIDHGAATSAFLAKETPTFVGH